MQPKHVISLGLFGVALGLGATPASSQDLTFSTQVADSAQTTPTPAAPSAAPAESGGEAPYLAIVHDGIRKIVVRDTDAAIALLRQAVEAEPNRPEAYCHLGDAQRIADQLDEAVAAYESCTRFAESAGDERLKRMGIVGQATTLETVPTRQDEAKTLFQQLLNGGPNDPAKLLGSTRIEAIDKVEALNLSYTPVRERIAAREAKNAAEAEEKAKKKK
jgi:tetratricopeptide (TPR) repeat protein